MDYTALASLLPLPLSRLLQRALFATSSEERHLNALRLSGAALRMAAALRIGIWLQNDPIPGSEIAASLEGLVLPSPRRWRHWLREVDHALIHRPDARRLPLGDLPRGLGRKRHQWEAVHRLAEFALQIGLIASETEWCASRRGMLGFFDLVLDYAERLAQRSPSEDPVPHEKLTWMWLEALAEVFADAELLGGMELFWRGREPADGAGWRKLGGDALEGQEAPPGVIPGGSDGLCLVGGGHAVSLHPLLICWEDEFGSEAVGFLHTAHRTTSEDQDPEGEPRYRPVYLDLTSGEIPPDLDPREDLRMVMGRLKGRPVEVEEYQEIEHIVATRPSDPPRALEEGQNLVSDLEVQEVIGRGGMGIVYRAVQRVLNRTVALKVLTPYLAEDEQALGRFAREIAALARCDHPNVVKILLSGRQEDRLYYAMEYIQGADLHHVIRRLTRWRLAGVHLQPRHIQAAIEMAVGGRRSRQDLPDDEPSSSQSPGRATRGYYQRLAELFAGAALGLEHLHEHGILHRDIKPGNLRLTGRGRRLVVMDLGLAKVTGATPMTRSGAGVLGTLRYMAPEQLRAKSRDLDPRVDVYGLGASLYEAVVGRPLHEAETETQLMHQILSQEPHGSALSRTEVPRDLAAIITVAISKDPRHRYATAQEMAEDLKAFTENRPVQASPPGPLARSAQFLWRHRVPAAFLAALVTLSGIYGVYWWDAHRIKMHRFANFTIRRQMMEGVGSVTAGQQRSRLSTYLFYSREDRIVRVERVEQQGRLVNEDGEGAVWELEYDTRGRIRETVVRDVYDQIIERRIHTPELGRTEIRDGSNNPKTFPGSAASVVIEEFDPRGFRKRETFANVYGSPRTDLMGAWGHEFAVDERGLITRRVPLDAQGNPSKELRIQAFLRSYDVQGNLTEFTLMGSDGRPTKDLTGYSTLRFRYDEMGNLIEISCLGEDKEPILNTDGFSTIRYSLDERGRVMSETMLGTSGQPIRSAFGFAIRQTELDQHGHPIGDSYLDEKGLPILNRDGYALVYWTINPQGTRTKESYFGTQGQPISCVDGYASLRRRVDPQGNIVEESYFDHRGEPTLRDEGYATVVRVFDEHRTLIEEAYLGVRGEPAERLGGYAKVRYSLDERGRVVQVSYFGSDGRVTCIDEGYAVLRRLYDDRNQLIELAYFGTDGKPMLNREGYATQRRRYDRQGRCIEETFHGIDGQPTLNREGCAGYQREYDLSSVVVREVCLGLDGQASST